MKSLIHAVKPMSAMLLLMLFLLPSCSTAPKNLVVLVADPDGKTGAITVSNKAGTETITRTNHSTGVKDAGASPTPAQPMDEKTISRIFGAALAAEPRPPEIFVLYFRTGSSELVRESAQLIPGLLAAIQSRKSTDISVVGHTDRVGTRQKNYEISFDRAERIKALLVSKGVDPRFIEIDSHGEDNPIIKTLDDVPEPKNRRVEVTVR